MAGERDLAVQLEAYYRANLAQLVRRAWHWCDSRAEAEDLVHEAFARLFATYVESASTPPAEAAIPALVAVTLKRLAIDQFRSKAVRTGETLGDDEGDGSEGEERASGSDSSHGPAASARDAMLQPDRGPGPEETAAARQVLTRLVEALPKRDIMILRMIWDGLSPPEIGAAFGRNGYTLRRVVRERAQTVLAGLAAEGDDIAASVLAQLGQA
jgi:RNA polymerase sigma factor (sigma-70 family)